MTEHATTTWTAVLEVQSSCECGWQSTAKNALGNAKRHATATGHVVTTSQVLGVTYAPRGLTKAEAFGRVRYVD